MNILDKLKTILDSDFQIQYNQNKIVYQKSPHYIQHNQKRQKIHCLKTFTFSHFQSVPSDLQPALNTIKNSFQARFDDQESKNQIEELFKQLVVKESIPNNSSPLNEFINNLTLILNNYPRYKFGNNLEVFDTKYGKLPANWDERKVFEEFNRQFDIHYDAAYEEDTAKAEGLIKLYEAVYNLIIPIKTVKIGFFIETTSYSTTRGASYYSLYNAAVDSFLRKGLPFLANLNFFHAHQDMIKFQFLWRDRCELYIEKNQSICLVMPKNKKPEDFGFEKSSFEMWAKSIDSLPQYEHVHLDLKSIMMEANIEERFMRFFFIIGHGTYETQTTKGFAFGLPIPGAKKMLSELDHVNTAGALISSCFLGHNAEVLFDTLPLTFPVFLTNSHSYYSTIEKRNYNNFLDAIEDEYLKKEVIKTLGKWQPTRAACERIIQATNVKRTENQMSYLLPANYVDIPRVAYGAFQHSSKVLDLAAVIKKKKTVHISEPIEINGDEWTACLLSHHLCPEMKLTGSKRCTFRSRGQQSWHILKGLDLGNIPYTIHWPICSLFDKQIGNAKKVFLIHKITYVQDGQPKMINHAVIDIVSENEIVLYFCETRYNFHKVTFNLKGTKQVVELPFEEAVQAIYNVLITAAPTSKHLAHTEAGRFSLEEIIEDIRKYFWNAKPNDDIEFFHLIFQKKLLAPHDDKKTFTIGKQIAAAIKSREPEDNDRKTLACKCIDFARNLNDHKLSYQIRDSFSNEFILAVLQNNLNKIQELLEKEPQLINSQDINGNNALILALSQNSAQIAHYLIDKEISLTDSNRFGNTCIHFIFKCDNLELAEKLIAALLMHKQGLDSNDQEFFWQEALEKATDKMDRFADLLLKYKIGQNANFPLIYNVANIPNTLQILAKILETYPDEDVNKPCSNSLNTPLHIVSEVCDMEAAKMLIAKGANVNAVNKEGLTPLQSAIKYQIRFKYEYVKLLLDNEALLDHKSNEGKTALHYLLEDKDYCLRSVREIKPKIFQLFLEKNADLHIPDNNGTTAKMLASKKAEFNYGNSTLT